MARTGLLTIALVREHDVVVARQRARQLAAELGLDAQDQIRFATAVSEIARNAHQYARGGRVEFVVESGPPGSGTQSRDSESGLGVGTRSRDSESESGPGMLVARVVDRGAGIPRLKDVLDGRYVSPTGMGVGITGARRLADSFDIASSGDGTEVRIGKWLPSTVRVTSALISGVTRALASVTSIDPLTEMQQQSQELLRALSQLREKQAESDRLAQELAETNRGVLALYAELDERAVYLERVNELKTRFLSDLNHEIRTPLNAVRNVARLLLDGYEGPLTERHRRAIEMMRQSTDTLSDLVNDWLDLAKIEAGRAEVHVDTFSVEEVWGALRGLFRPIETQDSVPLVFEAPPSLPLLHTDESKVAQILRNFISNALKFTERGEVRVSVREGPDDTVVFSVADTGIGIAPENMNRLFEEFAQIDNPLQRRVKGTGLGLPLSRRLARLLGGDVLVESSPGRGSVFSLILPMKYSGDSDVGGPAMPGTDTAAEVTHA